MDKKPQILLNRGNVFFDRYHITGSDNMNKNGMIKSTF